ncbi:MAG TPA: oligopeptide/dipeptide ABC transporter ATP-binding protein, partial [Anaerolineae bacterium]
NLENRGVFQGIPGLAPSLLKLPSGCVFHPRCQYAMDVCKTTVPQQSVTATKRYVYCHLYDKDGAPLPGTPMTKREAVTN